MSGRKKPTKDKLIGQIVIDVYEDDFTVNASPTIDLETVYLVAYGMLEYIEELAEKLDDMPTTMLQ